MAVSEETPIPGKPSLPIALAEAGMGHPFFLFTGRGLKGKTGKTVLRCKSTIPDTKIGGDGRKKAVPSGTAYFTDAY
jgi:hypothetical protein